MLCFRTILSEGKPTGKGWPETQAFEEDMREFMNLAMIERCWDSASLYYDKKGITGKNARNSIKSYTLLPPVVFACPTLFGC